VESRLMVSVIVLRTLANFFEFSLLVIVGDSKIVARFNH
jgi:hypothetical protein